MIIVGSVPLEKKILSFSILRGQEILLLFFTKYSPNAGLRPAFSSIEYATKLEYTPAA